MSDWWLASALVACLLACLSGYRWLMFVSVVYGGVVLTLWFEAARP